MSGFSAQWLALRESYDLRARNREVVEALVDWARPPLAVVDLACGTGASVRALGPQLPDDQDWRLVDNDLGLLARAAQIAPSRRLRIETRPIDLARDLEAALDGAVHLVTTSALLDLASAEWLDRLVVEVAARRLGLYAALSYDGRVSLSPADPQDAAVLASVNAHQRRDKGFGPALGPGAAEYAIEKFRALGYVVTSGAADWMFGAEDGPIQSAMLAGWASAARECGRVPLSELLAWLTRRRDAVAAGTSTMRIGHLDFFARPDR